MLLFVILKAFPFFNCTKEGYKESTCSFTFSTAMYTGTRRQQSDRHLILIPTQSFSALPGSAVALSWCQLVKTFSDEHKGCNLGLWFYIYICKRCPDGEKMCFVYDKAIRNQGAEIFKKEKALKWAAWKWGQGWVTCGDEWGCLQSTQKTSTHDAFLRPGQEIKIEDIKWYKSS